MRRILTRIVLGLGSVALVAGVATPASAAGSVCVSAQVVVNGSPVVDQAQCQDLPA